MVVVVLGSALLITQHRADEAAAVIAPVLQDGAPSLHWFWGVTAFLIEALARDALRVPWRPVAKDGATLPAADQVPTAEGLPLSIGETRDFEVSPTMSGQLRIEFRAPGSGLLIARVPVRVE